MGVLRFFRGVVYAIVLTNAVRGTVQDTALAMPLPPRVLGVNEPTQVSGARLDLLLTVYYMLCLCRFS